MAQVHEKERQLTREVAQTVEQGLPGVEVLAVELNGPERMTRLHRPCDGRRPRALRARHEPAPRLPRPVHGRRLVARDRAAAPHVLPLPGAVGHKVSIRTDRRADGRKKFRGTVAAADTQDLALDVADGARITIPYDAIVRGNLVDEGER